jgi:hypothetical protein
MGNPTGYEKIWNLRPVSTSEWLKLTRQICLNLDFSVSHLKSNSLAG